MIPVGGNATIAGFSGASPAAAGSIALGNVTIVSLPERLMALARPFTITATSAGQRNDTIVILRTPYGQVLVEADFSLPANRPLSLTIAVGNPPLKGHLALLAAPAKPEAAPERAAATTPAPAGNAASTELKPGATVRAMAVGPGLTEPNRSFPPSLVSLAAQRVAGSGHGGVNTPSISETALRVLQAPLLAQTVADAASARSGVPVSLPASVQPTQGLAFRILQIAPPTAGGIGPADSSSVARVVNTTLAGQPIVQFEGEVLVLDTLHRLATGTRLFVERITAPPAALEPEASAGARLATPASSPIAEAMQALTRAEIPPIAALRNQMQASHAQFSGTTLFLIAALRLGEPKTLLGERGLDLLNRSGRGALADQLRDAARRSSTTATDINHGEWRAQSLPMLDGDAIVPVQFAFRRKDEDDEDTAEQSAAKAQRFLVDVAPSQIGSMQLEGLLSGGRLDIVIRSEAPLDETLAAALSDRFSASLREAGLSGSLVIQPGSEGFVKLKKAREEVGLVA